jgi:fructokinase
VNQLSTQPGPKALSVVCWGELLWDLFPDQRRLGGALANVAYHLATFGDRALLVSRVGDDELGRAALEELGRCGVETRLVGVDLNKPTGSVHVEFAGGEPRYRISAQAAWDRIACSADVAGALESADAIVYGTLAQRTPLGEGALSQALKLVPPNTLRVCDLNVRRPFVTAGVVDGAISGASVVKLNEQESELVGELFGVDDVVDWLASARGVELVALTRGARGSVLATRERRVEHAGAPADATHGDSVGAGDAFTAALVHALGHGVSELELLSEYANRYAAFVASEAGAMPPVPAVWRRWP